MFASDTKNDNEPSKLRKQNSIIQLQTQTILTDSSSVHLRSMELPATPSSILHKRKSRNKWK